MLQIKKTVFNELTFQPVCLSCSAVLGWEPLIVPSSQEFPAQSCSPEILQGCQAGVRIQIRFQKGETQKDKCWNGFQQERVNILFYLYWFVIDNFLFCEDNSTEFFHLSCSE